MKLTTCGRANLVHSRCTWVGGEIYNVLTFSIYEAASWNWRDCFNGRDGFLFGSFLVATTETDASFWLVCCCVNYVIRSFDNRTSLQVEINYGDLLFRVAIMVCSPSISDTSAFLS